MDRSLRTRIGVGALLALVAARALAQDGPTESPRFAADWLGDVLQDETPPPSEPRWVRTGPGHALADVVVDPGSGAMAVVGASGAVWLVSDGDWRTVLPPVQSALGARSLDERVLLELESRYEELLELPDVLDLEGDPRDAPAAFEALRRTWAEEVDDARRVAAEEVRHELHGQPWFLEQAELQGRVEGALPQALITADLLMVGRQDGLWVSRDRGRSWDRALADLQVTAIAGEPGAWVVGTADGVWRSADLRRWRPSGLQGEGVRALAVSDDITWIGAASGLWRDDGRLQRVGAHGGAVIALLSDGPDLWVATPEALLRTDRAARVLRQPPGPPLPAIRSLIRHGDARIAVGSTGVWMEDGERWARQTDGLPVPGASGVAARGDAVWLATSGGLYRAGPAGERGAPVAFAPVGLLVEASVDRPPLVATAGSRLGAFLMPQLTVEGRLAPGDRLFYDPHRGTSRQIGSEWHVLTMLRWAPARNRHPRSLMANVDPEELGGIDLLDGTAPAVLEALTSRKAVNYRSVLAHTVTGLHAAHVDLVGRTAQLDRAPLRDRVHHALAILELEARLDALTDGAVSRWRHAGG